MSRILITTHSAIYSHVYTCCFCNRSKHYQRPHQKLRSGAGSCLGAAQRSRVCPRSSTQVGDENRVPALPVGGSLSPIVDRDRGREPGPVRGSGDVCPRSRPSSLRSGRDSVPSFVPVGDRDGDKRGQVLSPPEPTRQKKGQTISPIYLIEFFSDQRGLYLFGLPRVALSYERFK